MSMWRIHSKSIPNPIKNNSSVNDVSSYWAKVFGQIEKLDHNSKRRVFALGLLISTMICVLYYSLLSFLHCLYKLNYVRVNVTLLHIAVERILQ